MANAITNYFDNILNNIAGKLVQYMGDPMGREQDILHNYYNGDQRKQLKRTTDKDGKVIDDNITENRIGLNIDRSVSRLYQGGVEFELPEGKDEQQEYIDTVWDLNKKEIILFQAGLYATTDGTGYFKIRPDALIDPYTEKLYPRLSPLNPRIVRIKTHHSDVNEVEQYLIEYTCKEVRNGNTVDVLHREVTRRPDEEKYTNEDGVEYYGVPNTWVIEVFEKVGSAPIQLLNVITWPYAFPPIVHWKNLPSLEGCYGDSEADDSVNIQDKVNLVMSNIGKIIKIHAHPRTVGTGITGNIEIDAAVESFWKVSNADAKVFNLEMQSDLISSREFADDLRKVMSEISREVDSATLEKNLGAITNFALRVLYTDALNKNDTKRQLYGDAFLELNRRLLVLAGYEGEESRPGTVAWGDALPVNPLEEMLVDEKALSMKIVDHETVAKRYLKRYGVEWETIKANLEAAEKKQQELFEKQNPLPEKGERDEFNKKSFGERKE